jgi:Fe2+ transport system protein FeoA
MVRDRATRAKSFPTLRVLESASPARGRRRGGHLTTTDSRATPDSLIEETLGRPEDWLHLDEIQPEHCGLVAAVRAGAEEIERLKSMGVCVGRRLMLIRAGDPMIVRVLGSRIGISARLAQQVMVLPCAGDAFGES